MQLLGWLMCLPACKVQWEPQYLGICSVTMTATVRGTCKYGNVYIANGYYCILEHAVTADEPEC